MQKETVTQGPKEHTLLPLPFGPTLSTWKPSNSSPCMGRLYTKVWSKPMAWIYAACSVLPTRVEQISPIVITNSTCGNLV